MEDHGRFPASARAPVEARLGRNIPLSVLVVACSMACATAPHPKAQAPAREAASTETTAKQQDSREASPAVTPALRRLARTVDALEDSSDGSHRSVILALRATAGALRALDGLPDRDDQGPGAAADGIESSGPASGSHSDDLILGLRAARGRLAGLPAEGARTPAFEAALADLDGAVGALASARPLLAQRPETTRAFRALTNAAFLAAGHDAPFAGQERAMLATPSVDDLMKRLRSDASALATADMRTLRARAADGMLSLAELVSVLGGAEVGARGAEEITFQAERLRRAESAPFARSEWVERGLLAALQALESLETGHPEGVADWVEIARRAATDLPEHGTLSFQHARIQDAFRATVDAFGVALLDRRSCSPNAVTSGPDEPRRPRAEVP